MNSSTSSSLLFASSTYSDAIFSASREQEIILILAKYDRGDEITPREAGEVWAYARSSILKTIGLREVLNGDIGTVSQAPAQPPQGTCCGYSAAPSATACKVLGKSRILIERDLSGVPTKFTVEFRRNALNACGYTSHSITTREWRVAFAKSIELQMDPEVIPFAVAGR